MKSTVHFGRKPISHFARVSDPKKEPTKTNPRLAVLGEASAYVVVRQDVQRLGFVEPRLAQAAHLRRDQPSAAHADPGGGHLLLGTMGPVGHPSGCGSNRKANMGCPGKWKPGPKPAACPSCLIFSHTLGRLWWLKIVGNPKMVARSVSGTKD